MGQLSNLQFGCPPGDYYLIGPDGSRERVTVVASGQVILATAASGQSPPSPPPPPLPLPLPLLLYWFQARNAPLEYAPELACLRQAARCFLSGQRDLGQELLAQQRLAPLDERIAGLVALLPEIGSHVDGAASAPTATRKPSTEAEAADRRSSSVAPSIGERIERLSHLAIAEELETIRKVSESVMAKFRDLVAACPGYPDDRQRRLERVLFGDVDRVEDCSNAAGDMHLSQQQQRQQQQRQQQQTASDSFRLQVGTQLAAAAKRSPAAGFDLVFLPASGCGSSRSLQGLSTMSRQMTPDPLLQGGVSGFLYVAGMPMVNQRRLS